MKKITLLILLIAVSFGYSQEVVQDFESGGLGAPFGNLGSASIVADPEPMGTRGMVAELITSAAGNVWQGTNINVTQNVDLTTDKTMTIDVYSETALSLAVKVTMSSDGGPDSTTSIDHGGTGWETITATFNTSQDGSGVANGTYTNFVVYPNWDPVTNTYINPAIVRTIYVDNITGIPAVVDPCNNGMQDGDETGVDCGGSCPNTCPMPPTTAAPDAPARDAADVISIFSGEYTDEVASGINVFAGASLDNVTIEAADDTRRITAPTPGGGVQYEFIGVPPLDLTDFTHVHVDFYVEGAVEPGQVFQIFLIDFPNHPDGAGAYNLNAQFDVNAAGSGAWFSGDIALDDFNNSAALRDKIALVQLVAAGPQYGPIYFDNLYFYKFNDDCDDATPIVLDGNEITVSNIGATDSGVSASCDSGIISDVWYSFEGTATGEAYFTTTAPSLSVFTDCTGATELACNPGDDVAVTGLTMGTTYYLRINDDGTARAPGTFTLTASESALSTDDFDLTDFSAYPNPTTDNWNIKTNGQAIASVQVFDMLGKNVITLSPKSNEVQIDASTLNAGLYFARISSDNGTKTMKLVKQ